jgi:hypothetical protein
MKVVYVNGLLKLCSNKDCSYYTPPSMSNIVDILIANNIGRVFGNIYGCDGPSSPRFTVQAVFDMHLRDAQTNLDNDLKAIGSRRKFDIRKHFMKDGIMRSYAAYQMTKGGK